MNIVDTVFALMRNLTSAGSATTPETAVERSVSLGDSARDQRDWRAAIEAYTDVLEADPQLDHIWIQLGHAHKEVGQMALATSAYLRAVSIRPSEAEAHVHLAHAYKNTRQPDAAIRHFLQALHFGWDKPGENDDLLALMHQKVHKGEHDDLREQMDDIADLPSVEIETPFLKRIRAAIDMAPREARAEADKAADGIVNFVFDMSDLIGFWRSARLPTGIQRVQIEAIVAALAAENKVQIRLCGFISERDDWLEIPISQFSRLTMLATSGGDLDDPEWRSAVSDLAVHLSLTRPFEFPLGAILINLGTSWWLQNYFLFVRKAKAERGIRYVPFVHDMIPIKAPEHCTRELTQDFISWALGVFEYADHYLVNSQATRTDLKEAGALLGHKVTDKDVGVIPLNADFRKSSLKHLHESELAKWKLVAGDFVLFVSTIESRKGHLCAFEAWLQLIERLGAENVPQLVCVGNRGWLNDKVYEMLAQELALTEKVTMLSGLSDTELALLYRSCAFTIYPSRYEGWGLPVTESLCYGKVPLISNAASLPEAGGDFAVYVNPEAPDELAREAERLIVNVEYRGALEHKISEQFTPRSWSDLANQIVAELAHYAKQVTSAKPSRTDAPTPVAHVGAWHPMLRNTATRIWPGMSSAEKFRSDLGWFWPEHRGTRIRGSGGTLAFRIAKPCFRLRLFIALRGDETSQTRYSISCNGKSVQGRLKRDELSWTWIDVPAPKSNCDYEVSFKAREFPNGDLPTYFVRGFYLCDTADTEKRMEFIEALALDRLDILDAFGECWQTALTSQKRGAGARGHRHLLQKIRLSFSKDRASDIDAGK